MSAPTADYQGYLLKEAEQLRTFYIDSAKEIGTLERYTLIATGAIWSWGATHENASYLDFLVWVPVILQAFFGLRAWGIYDDMMWTRSYVSRIETLLELPGNVGWGRLVSERQRRLRIITGFAFWIALPILTIGIATLYAVMA